MLCDSKDREELLDALYASLPLVPSWGHAARTAARIFKCDQAGVLVGSEEDGGSAPIGTYAFETPTEPIDQLFGHGINPFPNGVITRISGAGGIAMLLAVADGRGLSATFALWRSIGQPDFGEAEEGLLLSLRDPLRRCLGIYRHIVELTRRMSVAEAALETSRIGIVLASSEGAIIHTNAVADDLLDNGDALLASRGHICASNPADNSLLIQEIRRQAAEQSAVPNWKNYTPLALSRRDATLPLTTIVRPGPAFHPLPNPLRRTAMLVPRDPQEPRLMAPAIFERLFGLTPAEAQLASRLARGGTLEDAAQELNVTRNTVRTQLQSIFQKTGVNRQTDLIRVLLTSVAASS